MISAKNYAAQAERGLYEFSDKVSRQRSGVRDGEWVRYLAERIGAAQHFALPDNGRLLDDNLRGLGGTEFRLPYKAITVEYFADYDPALMTENAPVYASKRLAYAEEISAADALRLYNDFVGDPSAKERFARTLKDSDEWVLSAVAFHANGAWHASAGALLIPREWQIGGGAVIEPLVPVKKNAAEIRAVVLPVCPGMLSMALAVYGSADLATRAVFNDLSPETTAVLELAEALTCSNVSIESLPRSRVADAINAGRSRNKKLPIYETKVLVINAGMGGRGAKASGGSHASPRQHLRRGHIRRLADKNIWVNSCVVGSLQHGRVDKSYQVRV